MRRYLVLIFGCVIAIVLVSAVNFDRRGSAIQVRRLTGHFYLQDGEPVYLDVLSDRIGLVAIPGTSRETVQQLVDAREWQVEPPEPGAIIVVRSVRRRDHRELLQVARTIVERQSQRSPDRPLRQAGLLVRTEGATKPILLTSEFIVNFRDGVTPGQIAELNARYNVRTVRRNPFRENQYVLETTADSALDSLQASRAYHDSGLVDLAQPNFVRTKVWRGTIPNDPLFGDQWHHENSGQNGGTIDADLDTPLAWDLTRGSASRVIAVIDTGFDVEHPDLAPNLWTNTGEVPGDGLDNDSNGYVDDLHGWNFTTNTNDLSGGSHGTSVAGCIGARGGNAIGVSGTCPECRLMLIVYGDGPTADFDDAAAFDYARVQGAEVINNSWGYDGSPVPSVVVAAIQDAAALGRGGLGCVILFAMPDDDVDRCGGAIPDISALPPVIAVSSSTNRDRRADLAFGDCMDVLAPSRNENGRTGTLGIATTHPGMPGMPEAYNTNFLGNSAAAAVTAGVAALMIDGDPGLTRIQIQRGLQDTADRIEDSHGFYSPVTGFSQPGTGASTHGYGRANAFEAVRLVAPTSLGGRGGVDVMFRDNRLDWGNTEQPSHTQFEEIRGFIPHWESADIKVDAPPYQAAPVSSQQFDALADEDPRASTTNKVYVRVRNRGPRPATTVTVKLHWAFAGTGLPALPADFWGAFPADSSNTTHWHPLPAKSLGPLRYSGSSLAGSPADLAQIVAFDFPAPALSSTAPGAQHYCLLAIADSPQDPVAATSRSSLVPDFITPRDNNVTQRNLVLQPAVQNRRFRVPFFARNPSRKPMIAQFDVAVPQDWTARISGNDLPLQLTLQPQAERLLFLEAKLPDDQSTGEMVVVQSDVTGGASQRTGGLTVRVGRR